MQRDVAREWSTRSPDTRRAPRILVIGAGLAGLSTGCYAQMSGMETVVLEKHVLPGGCCTAWSRGDYVFDYCIDWLIGTAPGNDAHTIWRELGALDGKSVKNFDMFNRVVGADGRAVTFYNDPDRLEQHLLEVSPRDAALIRAFCRDLRRFTRLDLYPFLKPSSLMSVRERLRLARVVLPAFRLFWRTGATSMHSFCEKLYDPLLRQALPNMLMQDHVVFPLLPYMFNLAAAYNGNAGFPQGGSLGLARSVEHRYEKLGGTVLYRKRVAKILVEDNRAVGVELKDGSRLYADHVVSACDGYTTVYRLLEGRYAGRRVDRLYRELLHRPGMVYPGGVSVGVGLKGDLPPDEPHCTTYLLSKEDSAALPAVMQDSIVVQLRSHYSNGFAPPDGSVIQCSYFSDYDHWKRLRTTDRRAYWAEKEKVARFVRAFLERHYPGIGDRTETVTVATPATTERYTGNYRGSILAWMAFTDADSLAAKVITKDRMSLPGLHSFSMVGQWVGGGGLIRVAATGRFAAQYLCRQYGLAFTPTESDGSDLWHPDQLGALPQLDQWARKETTVA
jgi:phytoene dehydrogenase-like protein